MSWVGLKRDGRWRVEQLSGGQWVSTTINGGYVTLGDIPGLDRVDIRAVCRHSGRIVESMKGNDE